MNSIIKFLKSGAGFISSPTHSRTTLIIVGLILLAAIPLTVIVSQQQQETRQRASSSQDQVSCFNQNTPDNPTQDEINKAMVLCGIPTPVPVVVTPTPTPTPILSSSSCITNVSQTYCRDSKGEYYSSCVGDKQINTSFTCVSDSCHSSLMSCSSSCISTTTTIPGKETTVTVASCPLITAPTPTPIIDQCASLNKSVYKCSSSCSTLGAGWAPQTSWPGISCPTAGQTCCYYNPSSSSTTSTGDYQYKVSFDFSCNYDQTMYSINVTPTGPKYTAYKLNVEDGHGNPFAHLEDAKGNGQGLSGSFGKTIPTMLKGTLIDTYHNTTLSTAISGNPADLKCYLKSPPPTPTAATSSLYALGDANNNGVIDILDFNIWRSEFISKTGLTSDFNNSKAVDILDFNIWRTSMLDKSLPHGK